MILEIGPNLLAFLTLLVPIFNTALLAFIAVQNSRQHSSVMGAVRDRNEQGTPGNKSP